MKKPLFVYGILQFQEILTALLGHAVRMERATLSGYERCRKPVTNGIMRGPGILVSPSAEVSGFLLTDLSAKDLVVIDVLEGQYDRTPILVKQNGVMVAAEVYFPTDTSNFIPEPWDPEEFRRTGLDFYVKVRIPEILNSKF
jgi:hypothetical protein